MENLFWIGFVGALIAALFAWMQAKRVLSYSEGSERMQKIAASIRSAAKMRPNVLFPVPFGPMIPTISPLWQTKSKCSATTVPSKALWSPCVSSTTSSVAADGIC